VGSVICNVLIVESDDHILRARGDELLLDGYEVLDAQTDPAARARLADGAPDALILGTLDTPAASLQLLRDLRAGAIPRADSRLPALSTGADTDHQAVRHYQAGSDIALPSTASPLLIAAGLTGFSQRQGPQRRRVLRVGSLTVDSDARTATIDDQRVLLSRLEFDLLQTLARAPHTTHSRQQLAKTVWGDDVARGRTIDTHVGRLRQKLGAAGAEPLSKASAASATASPAR
jgi:DNA-binding response OmpR family regulator